MVKRPMLDYFAIRPFTTVKGTKREQIYSMLSSPSPPPPDSIDKSSYFTSQIMGVAGQPQPQSMSLCDRGCFKALVWIHNKQTTTQGH